MNLQTIIPALLLLVSLASAGEPAWHPVEITTRSYLAYSPEYHMPPVALESAAEKTPVVTAALDHFRSDTGPKPLAKWRMRYADADLYLTTTLRLAPDFQVVRVTGVNPDTAHAVGREWLPVRRNPPGDWQIGAFPMNRPFAALLASPPSRGRTITSERTGFKTTRPQTVEGLGGVSGRGWRLTPTAFRPSRVTLPTLDPAEAILCVVEKNQTFVTIKGFTVDLQPDAVVELEQTTARCGEEVAAVVSVVVQETKRTRTTHTEVSPLVRCGPYLACRYRPRGAGDWSLLALERSKNGTWIPADEAFLPPTIRGWSGSTNGLLHWDAVRERSLAAPPKIQQRGIPQ